jgi:cytochrome c biogenesis protein CcdA
MTSPACAIGPTPRQMENRGLTWVFGAFLFCPCHLPLTLAVAATALSGTALGIALRAHLYVAGALVTIVWAAATWRGIVLLRLAARRTRATADQSEAQS